MASPVRLFDFTAHYSADGWVSGNPELIQTLGRKGYVDTTPIIAKRMDRLNAQAGYREHTFDTARYGLLWSTKFHRNTDAMLFIFSNWLPDIARKVIPSCFASGIKVLVIHSDTKKSAVFMPTQAKYIPALPDQFGQAETPPEADMRAAWHRFNEVEDFLGICRTNAENLELMQEEAVRFRETAEALGLHAKSNGPITAASQIKAQIEDLDFVRHFVEQWAPLYDIDIPNETVVLHEYEDTKRINVSHGMESHKYRPNATIRSPHTNEVRLEDTTQLCLIYLQIKFYIASKIRPAYYWVDAPENIPLYEDSTSDDEDEGETGARGKRRAENVSYRPSRLTPRECVTQGLHGRISY